MHNTFRTAISVIGVGVGVMFMILLSALMTGFEKKFVTETIESSPHITIYDEQRQETDEFATWIGDQTHGEGTVRTLDEQVALETRTRMLNPKWYEGMLAHGYEGVRQIESAITNTMGWSATTGQVAPWVYQQLTQTFMLDPAMRDRLAQLNPHASAKVAQRLLEASARQYWTPDAEMLDALQRAGDELEDRLEGVYTPRMAA